MTQRIRSKSFACLLRQEVAYFDRPENSSGAISTRLSSDASAVQEMIGTRLGVMCEAITILGFGIILGGLIDWQLTLIVFSPVLIACIATYCNVWLRLWLDQQSQKIVGRASSVRSSLSCSYLYCAKH